MIKKTAPAILIFSTWLILLMAPYQALANAAQPGVWNAGGTVFSMLYPEDSVTFKKVQMVEEKIYIQLYKGYAVVKGTYLFRNTTKEKLNFRMGYPVNGIYYGGETDLNEVSIDSLSCFNIKTKGNRLPLLKEAHPELNHDYKSPVPSTDNWMVWQMSFDSEESQTVEVHFIVNTNNAKIRKGYNTEQRNAFIYLLESGSVWRQPIEKGNFYMQLKDGLTLKDIQGLSSGFGFRYNEIHQLFAGTKVKFSPTPKDNLVVNYYKRNETFSFKAITTKSDSLFAKIDTLSLLPIEILTYTQVETGDPYEVESTFWGNIPGLVMLLVIFAPVIAGVIVIIIIRRILIRWIRRKRPIK